VGDLSRDHTQSVPSPCSRSTAPHASPPRWRKRLMPGGDRVQDRQRTPPLFPSDLEKHVARCNWSQPGDTHTRRKLLPGHVLCMCRICN
jgi:hypothetical protein